MLKFDASKTWLSTRVAKTDRGASLVEYALLVAFIAAVCIAAVTTLGTTTDDQFGKMNDRWTCEDGQVLTDGECAPA
jgi:pilus assembly protein Flp/PilA